MTAAPARTGRARGGGGSRARGRSTPWALERGATVLSGGAVRFEVWAPRARTVAVRVFDEYGVGTDHPLEPHGGGVYATVVKGVPAGRDYRYVLDGEREVADPVSRYQPDDVFGPSRIVDPSAFQWHDQRWTGLAMPDLVLYELHVGTFSEQGTFDGVIPHLEALRDLGVTAIELMPVAEFPGGRNWGYDGVHLFAPESAYGGPDGLRRLVDAAHDVGLGVVLDVVYNHTGPEGSVLHEYGPYFVERYRTPWGGSANFDGPQSDEVRRFVVDNALYWITEYHLDGLRLDATDQIYDFSARHVLEEMAAAVHAQADALGRRVVMIAETALNDPRWVRPPNVGGFGMDGQWLDDFHHAVRTAVTSERLGYYGDYRGVASLAKSYRDRYVFDGVYSSHWQRRRGRPATDVSREAFVAFIQNHDQVGNRARGERLPLLAGSAQRRVAAAALLLSPYVPLLFMGEEYGETRPFLYFVSHRSPELVEAVRRGRREEFSAFAWHDEVPDPQAESSFAASRLDRAAAEGAEQRATRALYGDLLRLRRAVPLLRPGDAELRVTDDADAGWMSALYHGGDEPPHLLLLNFAASARALRADGAPHGEWRCLLCTDAARYGGQDRVASSATLTATAGTIELPPHTAALYVWSPE